MRIVWYLDAGSAEVTGEHCSELHRHVLDRHREQGPGQ